MLISFRRLIGLEDSSGKTWAKPSVVHTTKYCTELYPKGRIISLETIKIPYVPVKPHEDSAHHQVVTWTLYCTNWNKNTVKLITPSFGISDSVLIGSFYKCLLIFVC